MKGILRNTNLLLVLMVLLKDKLYDTNQTRLLNFLWLNRIEFRKGHKFSFWNREIRAKCERNVSKYIHHLCVEMSQIDFNIGKSVF